MAGWTGNAGPWLFYLFHALPIVAALIAPRERRAWIWPLAVVAVLANVGMIRDKLDVRLPDVIVPASLLLIWVATRLWTITSGAGAMALRALVVAIVLATGAATLVVGNTSEQLGRAAMFSSSRSLPGRFVDHAAELRQRFPAAQVPSATVAALIPFMAWADRCLGDGDHILVPHFLPEVAVWARQPFAGGQVWYQAVVLDRPQDHRLVIQRLSRQRVPVAVLELEDAPYFDVDFPELARYLERFTEPQRFTMREGQVIEVRFDPSFIRSRDAETGWPCYL
jgi:hypothetical protein